MEVLMYFTNIEINIFYGLVRMLLFSWIFWLNYSFKTVEVPTLHVIHQTNHLSENNEDTNNLNEFTRRDAKSVFFFLVCSVSPKNPIIKP